jgi:hypothetical protein
LARNAVAWTAELIQLLDAGANVAKSVWDRYRQQDVKDTAANDSHGKCVYCESRIAHVGYAHLEHLQPKIRFPRHAYEWNNLALVCPRCNISKGDQYDELLPPVNPFEENPHNFFAAWGELLWPLPGNDRARETIALTDLNRAALLTQRRARVKQIQNLAETYARCSSVTAKAALLEQLMEELDDAGEYAFFARSVAVRLGVIAREEIDRMEQ